MIERELIETPLELVILSAGRGSIATKSKSKDLLSFVESRTHSER